MRVFMGTELSDHCFSEPVFKGSFILHVKPIKYNFYIVLSLFQYVKFANKMIKKEGTPGNIPLLVNLQHSASASGTSICQEPDIYRYFPKMFLLPLAQKNVFFGQNGA